MASEPKWTKGPIIVDGRDVYLSGENGFVRILTTFLLGLKNVNVSHQEAHANAVLFAAAPGLYEALRVMVERFDPNSDTFPSDHPIVTARAALAKARGDHDR